MEVVILISTIVMTLTVVNSRQYYNTKEELQLTRSRPRIEANPCDADKSVAILVHSAAHCSGMYFDKRQAVRKTWASVAKERYNVSTYFAIALNANESVNSELQSEAEQHMDMIQFSFIDDYYNLTLKNVALLRWVYNKCRHLKYILKTDDDVIVNIDLLNRTLDQFKPGYTGHRSQEVVRSDVGHKQHIKKEYYRNKYAPECVYGGAYMLSTDAIGKLLTTIDNYEDYVLDIDDIFITGIIAEKAGVSRHWDSRFKFGHNCQINDNNLCRMCSLIALVQCKTDVEMVSFYRKWQQFNCTCILSPEEASSLTFLLVSSILFTIIFVIVSVVVILFVVYKKNKTSQRNTH